MSELFHIIDSLKGKKLALMLVGIIVSFSLIGLLIGKFIPQNLNQNEPEGTGLDSDRIEVTEGIQYKGKVVYVDPNFYPLDKISYALEDEAGKEVILLAARDEKLSVVEGLNVILYGKVEKTKDAAEDVLIVEKVIVENK